LIVDNADGSSEYDHANWADAKLIAAASAPTGDASTTPVPAVPTVTLALSPSSVPEDGTGNLVYSFTRSGSTSSPLTVNYTIGGGATNGTDYAGIGTAVTFAPGSSTAAVTVNPTADTSVEPDETVALTLSSGSGYAVGTTVPITGTIQNDDRRPMSVDPITGLTGWELNASNTGLAALGINGSQLPIYTGPGRIPAGSRISGVRFTTPIDLSLGDIIIERSLFQPLTAGAGMPLVTTVDFNQFRPLPGKVIIRDSEIDGSLIRSNRSDFSDQRFRASVSAFEGVADLQRNYIHGMGSGIVLRNTGTQFDALIEHNYVDNLVAWGDAATNGSHNNSITIRDFTDRLRPDREALIRNNRFEVDTPRNASASMQVAGFNDFVNNLTVEGNLLEGYGYNLWLAQSNRGFGNNMSFVNNRFTPLQWGASYSDRPGWSTWGENYIFNPLLPDGRGTEVFQ
jgi:hypothetical protein